MSCAPAAFSPSAVSPSSRPPSSPAPRWRRATASAAPRGCTRSSSSPTSPSDTSSRGHPRSPGDPPLGATRYEFQLSKTAAFGEGSIFYKTWVKSPAVAIPVALPWMTGQPYAAYARVRARTSTGAVTLWSRAFGFNVRWAELPTMRPSVPGLSRWTTVEGATSYHVWFVDSTSASRHARTPSTTASSTRSTARRSSWGTSAGACAPCAPSTARCRAGCRA